jgi:NADH-quinone oxidoreductase subunit I
MAVVDSVKGFGVTFRHLFRKPVTQQYVGCSLCAAACPADCIRVVADENTDEERYSPGERYARIYEINMSRCIFCGYCELACPFDAITLGNEYELSEYSRDDLIYTKDMLLAEPIKKTPVADSDLYDTPIPFYKEHS